LFIVLMHGLAGVDAYTGLGATYLLANLAVGVAVILLALYVSRRYADRIRTRVRECNPGGNGA